MDKRDVIIDGYYVKGTIEFQKHHPLTTWWIGIIQQLEYYDTLQNLIEELDITVPSGYNRVQILEYLVMSLLAHGIINVDWETGKVSLTKPFDEYARRGTLGQRMFETKKLHTEWWIEGIQGNPLSVLLAQKYDLNFSDDIPEEIIKVPAEKILTLLVEKNYNIRELMPSVHGGFLVHGRKSAFLRTSLSPSGHKSIRFSVIKSGRRYLLPPDLEILEQPLLSRNPSILDDQKEEKTSRLELYHSPLVEAYFRITQTFGSYETVDRQLTLQVIEFLDSILQMQEEILDYYTSSSKISQIVGESELFFNKFNEMLSSTSRDKRVIVTSSFLNPSNINEGLELSLKENTLSKILVIYGHANDDTSSEHNQKIREYISELRKYIPEVSKRFEILPARVKSHEKILITTEGEWMICSWNLTSSDPVGVMFESGICGRDGSIALELFHKIENLVNNEKFLTEFKESLTQLQPEKSSLEKEFMQLIKVFEITKKIHNTDSLWNKENYTMSVMGLLSALLPFMRRSRIQFVDTASSRDLLLRLINRTRESIFLATDRLSRNAMDPSAVNDLLRLGTRGKRKVGILWGREYENSDHKNEEIISQLLEAKETINVLDKEEIYLFSQTNPMENHSKFIVVDETVCYLTSENILSYGGEKKQNESRELGVYFEAPVISIQLLSKAVMHRQHIFDGFTRYGSEWFELGNQLHHAIDTLDLPDIDINNPAVIFEAIRDELQRDREDIFDNKRYRKSFRNFQNFIETHGENMRNGYMSLLLIPSPDHRWIPSDIEGDIQNYRLEIKDTAEDDTRKDTDPIVDEIMENMVWIEPGVFTMGSNKYKNSEETPAHQVRITKGFWMSKYIITQSLYERVMGRLSSTGNSKHMHPEYPVFYVSYGDMMEFIGRLNSLSGGGGFDLPTEAEWEYACRAGTKGDYFFGDRDKIDEYVWSKKNSNKQPHRVGEKKPNNWGLYDMLGLAYENVKDDLRRYKRSNKPIDDPVGSLNSKYCGARGGAWGKWPFGQKPNNNHFRCSSRPFNSKDEKSRRLSFRIVRRTDSST